MDFKLFIIILQLVFCRINIFASKLENISNQDITWSGDYIGIIPCMSGISEKLSANKILLPDTKLFNLLLDKNCWVAAHTILTIRADKGHVRDNLQWNGLIVVISAKGKVEIKDSQRFILERKWRKLLKRK